MKSINHTELCEYLRQFNSVFIGFVSETVPDFKKGGRGKPTFTEVTGRKAEGYRKITEGVVLVGTTPDYNKLVQNRMKKTGSDETFEPGARVWGERKDAIEVVHTNKDGVTKHYVTFHFVANNQPKIRYTYEGHTIELTEAEKSMLPKKSYSVKQENAGLEEDQQIIHREYEVSNIKSITVNHETIPVI